MKTLVSELGETFTENLHLEKHDACFHGLQGREVVHRLIIEGSWLQPKCIVALVALVAPRGVFQSFIHLSHPVTPAHATDMPAAHSPHK